MFANLKNKLIEEVKASPSKFQQFANAAQAAVSSSTSTTPSGSESTTTTNENFFSITEEDTPQNSPYKPLKLPTRAAPSNTSPQVANNGISSGAIPRTRRLSASSMASDISFRLPAYETSSAYHLQSDLDISASEVEDSASSMKLETITKEHLYNAYRKSLDRYHKYRCRYTDLAKKYKDLERDSTKARSVLVETQEKAIRRISELREQCALEQQAKAHLEEALRMEMDDMQCKMQAYQTKLKLLGESPEQIAAALASGAAMANEKIALIDLNASNNENNGKFSNAEADAKTTDGDRATQLQQQLVECEMKLQDMTIKYEESTATIDLLRKQEEENALSLAQTKQAIYSELESKDREVKTLQDAMKRLQSDLQNVTKDKPFSAQAKKELDAKIIASDHLLAELREKYSGQEKALLEAEDNLASLRKESEQKLSDMRQQNAQLNEMIERYQRNEVSLAEIDNELNRTKNENDTLKATLQESQRRLNEMEREANERRDDYEQMLNKARLQSEEQLREVESKMENYAIQLEESRTDRESLQLRLKQLQTDLQIANEQTANSESETIATLKQELRTMHEELSAKENEVKACTSKLAKQRKQHDTQQAIITQQTEEIEKLRDELGAHAEHLRSLQLQAKEREEEAEREKAELKEKVASILNEIAEMEQQMREVQQSQHELEQEKRSFEEKIEKMRIKAQGADHWQEQLETAEAKLAQVEEKLQNVENENSQMAEKNCLLEESSTRLKKLIAERDREKSLEDEATTSEMRLKLKVAESTIQKLNDKLTQVLDENSHMHNTRELMDHDYRTLQDKCDALEKEKLLAVDTQSCLEQQKEKLEEERIAVEIKLQEMSEVLKSSKNQLEIEQKKGAEAEGEFQRCRQQQHQLESEIKTLNEQLKELQDRQTDDELKLREDLQQQKQLAVDLEMNVQILQATQKELSIMEEKLQSADEELEIRNEELLLLRENNAILNAERKQREEEFESKEQMLEAIQTQLLSVQQELQSVTEDLEHKNQEIEAVQSRQLDEQKLKDLIQQKQHRIDDLESEMQKFSSTERQFDVLQEKFQTILEDLEHKNEDVLQLREKNEQLNEELKITREDMKQKLALIEDMQIYQTELKSNQSEEVVELKEKVTELNEELIFNKQQLNALQTKAHELQNTLKNAHEIREKDLQKIKELELLLGQLRETEMQTSDKLANFEQLKIENEYLNKNVQQLEADLEQQKQSSNNVDSETTDLKAKLKSVQCELYVQRESLQKHNSDLEQKQSELEQTQLKLSELKHNSELEKSELNRQADHITYITEQNDKVQKELLHAQQQVAVLERNQEEVTQELESTKAELQELRGTTESKEDEVIRLSGEIVKNQETIELLQKEVREITAELQAKEKLALELSALKVELAEQGTASKHQVFMEGRNTSETLKASSTDSEHLRKLNAILQNELEDLKHKSTAEISNLQQEIEELQSTTNHMTEKMLEYERSLAAATEKGQKSSSECIPNSISHDRTKVAKESNDEDDHEAKLKNIMQEVQDVSNRNLFLEQKCENFLILEQSNERLKLQNAKLSRQLDETLVSMQHSEGITANTEFEYLKNIMFQYLTGSATGNNETLVKVISAVLKFSPQQTQVAIEKEHQRRSLVNKIL